MMTIRIYVPKTGKFYNEITFKMVAKKFTKNDLEDAVFSIVEGGEVVSYLDTDQVISTLDSLWDV